ncbi:coiled-coil domain-containing protein [Neoroseomonas lacus]|uniref:Uncharacterized protein n=1 Tax=Neoroseomonas lacus TaxID=287609 RepID=A0A917KX35_9PROT|nr:hypothetical protein [Neoroseomonas lacus]GGJ34061.1 hypothetical protein GCM10011320_47160 [Neoroseomonas lacus]
MVNGVNVLQEVDARLSDAQREASAAQTEADRLAAQREGLRTEEAEALRELARLRLMELADGRQAVDALDAAGAQVRESLARRASELEAVQRGVLDARDALVAAEARRDAEVARHRAVQEAEATALKAADAKAAEDLEFQRLSKLAEEAERVAQHAEQKSGFAERDFEEKGRPYRADPLFAYLWDRGWGTGRYRAFPLVRMIDGWVAKLIEFEPARRSYALLSELPGSMTSHAGRMRAEADAAVRAMVERRRALAGLPEGGGRIDPASLEAAEDAVEAARAALTEAEAKRSALASGEDPASQQAIRALEAAIGARSLRTLREEASRTPTREDDAIVARLEITAAERARLENALADAQAQADGARRRLTELQTLRHDMRTRGVERSDWGFASGALVGALVGELLRGALSRDGFWDRMERQRMPDQMPGTSQPGPWGKPLPGPWGRPAPGPWSSGSAAPPNGGWWDEDKSAYWGKGKPQGGGGKGGGWRSGGGDAGGGFSTGGSSDSGGGFRTGGSV